MHGQALDATYVPCAGHLHQPFYLSDVKADCGYETMGQAWVPQLALQMQVLVSRSAGMLRTKTGSEGEQSSGS